MKYNNGNENINKFKYSTLKNNKNNQINNNIKRKNKSPIYDINKKSLIKDNETNKSVPKYYSNYDGSIYNINSLLGKMNSLKKLMYNASDLKSMLVMDQYGLKYSNDLRRNINSAKKLLSPHSPKINKYKIFENKDKNNDNNIKYFQRINEQNNLANNKNDVFLNSSNDFDLTNVININKTKKEIKQIFYNEKKDQKLYYLKTELFLLDQQLKDSLLSDNKIKNNKTFIREDIIKDNQYSRIKSKYMDKIKNKRKKNLIILNKFNTKSLRLKHFSKNTINRNKIIKLKLNEEENENRDNSKIEETIKLNKKTKYFKDKINSYKAKKIIYNKTFTDGIYNNRNLTKEKNNLKTHTTTAPNLTIFNNSIVKNNKNQNLQKISLIQLTNSNNSQENTTLNSLNSSAINNDMFHPKYKNIIKLTKNYRKNNNTFNISNYRNVKKTKKKNLINQINCIIDKSNNIKKYFVNSNDETAKFKKRIFSKHSYDYNKNKNININKINKYFNFSKKEEIDINEIIKQNTNKVKAIMDKKCSKLLDNIINELLFKERRLKKEYLGLSSYEKKMLKIKRENDLKKLNKQHVLKQKEMEKDKILETFITENQEIINLLKENNNNLDNSIEKTFTKTKVLKKCIK